MAAAAQPRRGAILLPAISAHRGGCETAPAGTMRAYREALAAGADYLEFDVRATAGGTLVAFHPARVAAGRLTARRPVSALSYTALCELAGYEVPTAADLLALAAQAQAAAHIDLKDPACTARSLPWRSACCRRSASSSRRATGLSSAACGASSPKCRPASPSAGIWPAPPAICCGGRHGARAPGSTT
jgi:glycerophosphoryl diester phosphodiesterase